MSDKEYQCVLDRGLLDTKYDKNRAVLAGLDDDIFEKLKSKNILDRLDGEEEYYDLKSIAELEEDKLDFFFKLKNDKSNSIHKLYKT